MGIALNRKTLNYFYLLFILLDLFLIAILLLDIRSQPLQLQGTMLFIKDKLDLKKEGNLATWYSSISLFITGVLAFANLRVNPFSSIKKWIYISGWSFIGCLLLILSADESAQMHESIATLAYLSRTKESRGEITIGAGDWLPFLMPFIVASVIGLISFLAFSFSRCKKIIPIALLGVSCWVGALVAEAFEGNPLNTLMNIAFGGMIEESLEVIGTTLLMIAFAEHFYWRQQASSPPSAITLSD